MEALKNLGGAATKHRNVCRGNVCEDHEPEGEVGDKREALRYRLPSSEDTDTDTDNCPRTHAHGGKRSL